MLNGKRALVIHDGREITKPLSVRRLPLRMEFLGTQFFFSKGLLENRQILYILYSQHLVTTLVISKSEMNERITLYRSGLSLQRSNTAEAAHNNVNQEPKMFVEFLVLPLSIFPQSRSQGKTPRASS